MLKSAKSGVRASKNEVGKLTERLTRAKLVLTQAVGLTDEQSQSCRGHDMLWKHENESCRVEEVVVTMI